MPALKAAVACFTHKHDGKAFSGLPAPMPCPFCGKMAHVMIEWVGAGFRGDCYGCGASGPLGATPLQAAQHWNARADL
jgi:hypothetical protein